MLLSLSALTKLETVDTADPGGPRVQHHVSAARQLKLGTFWAAAGAPNQSDQPEPSDLPPPNPRGREHSFINISPQALSSLPPFTSLS